MAKVTAGMVRDLREQTGAGMMDCKKALTENDGDIKAAAEYLMIKGIAKADKKAGRIAAEGLVATYVDGKTAGIVEVNCETDFVALNEEFIGFCNDLAKLTAAEGIQDVESLLAAKLNGTVVEEVRKAKVASIGEKVSVRRAGTVSVAEAGAVGDYIHQGGSHACIISLKATGDVTDNAAVQALAKDLCMHVTASKPLYVRTADVDATVREDQARILREQALESGKPPEIVEKMIVGRIKKWEKEICLLSQPFVKNPDISVSEEIARIGKEVGVTLDVDRFVVFARGEGIEKKESNLAEEVAATLK